MQTIRISTVCILWKACPTVRSSYITSVRYASKMPEHGTGSSEVTASHTSRLIDFDAISAKHGTEIHPVRVGFLDLAKSKLYDMQSFYDDFSGMSEVKAAHKRVIDVQEQLQMVQDRRRQLLMELMMIRNQMREIHIELQRTPHGEIRYLQLIKDEYDTIVREKEKNEVFMLVDQEERELFTILTAAVKNSHEKERFQANNVKYWPIISSCVAALLGVLATVIGYYYRDTMFSKIQHSIQETNMQHEQMSQSISATNDYVAVVLQEIQQIKRQTNGESWGSYFKRHTVRAYRYFIPKKD